MQFPIINHISEMLPFIQHNPQFRVQEQPNGTTVICYMLQDEDTFRGEHDFWYKECRGITFHADGTVAARTLHKFQNVGENDATQADQIPWEKITRIMDKRDGSMITPVQLLTGELVCKTKKTFTSNEAIAATEFLHKDPQKVAWCKAIIRAGWTPTFEWTSPRFPIVLTYDKDELTLLQLRHNVTGTYADLQFGLKDCPFPIVENIAGFTDENGRVSWEKFKEAQLTVQGVEGWIVQTNDGDLWKIKTKWYCDLHHSVTFTRWRDVAKAVLADESDDLKAAFAMTGKQIEPIVMVENKIKSVISARQDSVRNIVNCALSMGGTAKQVALMFKSHEDFGLIMTMFRGKEPDWFDWYKKHFIKTWSLDVIAAVGEDFEIPDANTDE